jgi:hypothetical protein
VNIAEIVENRVLFEKTWLHRINVNRDWCRTPENCQSGEANFTEAIAHFRGFAFLQFAHRIPQELLARTYSAS